MRDNPVKATLARGGRARGAMVFECFVPGMAQIGVNAGCDFLLYDLEHTGASLESFKAQCAMCRGLPVVPLVRVPRGEYHFIARALDVGALGVMVPMVDSAAEAAFVVGCTRYPPEGRRGAAFGFAHDEFGTGDPRATMAAIHDRTLVIAQIETAGGLAEVDAIAATRGVDVLWIGHYDLTNALGIPGDFAHPRYVDAVARVAEACAKHGKTAAILVGGEADAKRYAGLGFRMLAWGVDALMLQQALARGMATLAAAAT